MVHGCSTTQCKLQFIIIFAIADAQIYYDIQIGYRERIWSVNYVINFLKVARCLVPSGPSSVAIVLYLQMKKVHLGGRNVLLLLNIL